MTLVTIVVPLVSILVGCVLALGGSAAFVYIEYSTRRSVRRSHRSGEDAHSNNADGDGVVHSNSAHVQSEHSPLLAGIDDRTSPTGRRGYNAVGEQRPLSAEADSTPSAATNVASNQSDSSDSNTEHPTTPGSNFDSNKNDPSNPSS